MSLDTTHTRAFVQRTWDADIIPALTAYIRIPAKSPMYDDKWAEHGHLDRAVTLITSWAQQRKIEGLKLEGTMPLAAPECTPSVSTSTVRLPLVTPRSDVVAHR